MSVYEYLDTLEEDEIKRKAEKAERIKFEAMTTPIKSYDKSWLYSNTLVEKIVKNVTGEARLKMYEKAEKLKADYNWPMATCKAQAIGFYYEDDGWHHKKKISVKPKASTKELTKAQKKRIKDYVRLFVHSYLDHPTSHKRFNKRIQTNIRGEKLGETYASLIIRHFEKEIYPVERKALSWMMANLYGNEINFNTMLNEMKKLITR